MTDLFDSPQPGESARREANRAEAARLRRGDPSERPSAWETRFRQGGEGEAYLGGRLNEEAQRRGGIAVLHDLVVPGRRANIDHLVVGPAGVAIIDAKAWSGRVWIGREVIGQGRRGRRKPLEGMSRQLNRVHAVLAAAGRDDVAVQPMLCFVNANRGLPSRRLDEVGGVLVGIVAPVMDYAMRAGQLGSQDILEIYELLAASFDVQGGSLAPTAVERPSIPTVPAPARHGRHLSRRTRRPRRHAPPRGRLARELRRIVGEFALVAVAFAMIVGVIESAPGVVLAPAPPLSRQQLRQQLPQIRSLARAHAHGAVRRARVVTRRSRFVVRFQSGRRCQVAVMVPRNVASPLSHARVSTSRCRA